MEFRNLVTFLKVAELKNISKAAEKLGYSQSAVTIQIKQLEKELEVQLFERIGKGVSLTDKGKEFIFHANEILRVTAVAMETTKHSHAHEPEQLTGILNIGSVESISTALLPDILIQFHKQYPKVEIVVHTSKKDELINKIHDNTIDLFLTLEQKSLFPNLHRTLLSKEPIIFIAPIQNDYIKGNKIDLESISKIPFVLTEKGESYRYELERLVSQKDIKLHSQLEIGNTETIVHLVEAGIGISYLPYFSAKNAIQKGTIMEVKNDFLSTEMWIQMFYHKNKWISPQLEALISVIENFFNEGSNSH